MKGAPPPSPAPARGTKKILRNQGRASKTAPCGHRINPLMSNARPFGIPACYSSRLRKAKNDGLHEKKARPEKNGSSRPEMIDDVAETLYS